MGPGGVEGGPGVVVEIFRRVETDKVSGLRGCTTRGVPEKSYP